MAGIIGKKIGMTSTYTADGKNLACTVIQAGPCVVTQVKTKEKDGYEAIQLGFGEKKEHKTSKPMQGHFKKANTTPKREIVEFEFDKSFELGTTITAADVFAEGDKIRAIGTSKGKGFQGVVKRHNFSGVGGATHGQHNRLRAPGSIGACSYPARVFKGTRMGGRMGTDRVTVRNLKILKLMPEQNLIIISGSIPGANNSFVYLEK